MTITEADVNRVYQEIMISDLCLSGEVLTFMRDAAITALRAGNGAYNFSFSYSGINKTEDADFEILEPKQLPNRELPNRE